MMDVLENATPETRYQEYRAEERRIKAQDEVTFERNNRMRFYFLAAGAIAGPLVFFYLQGLSWENVPLAAVAIFIGFMVGSLVSFFFERDETNTIALVNSRNEVARKLVEKTTQGSFLEGSYVYLRPEQWNEITLDFGAQMKTVMVRVQQDATVEWKPKTA